MSAQNPVVGDDSVTEFRTRTAILGACAERKLSRGMVADAWLRRCAFMESAAVTVAGAPLIVDVQGLFK